MDYWVLWTNPLYIRSRTEEERMWRVNRAIIAKRISRQCLIIYVEFNDGQHSPLLLQ